MRFQTRHLKNILKITPSFDTLSNVYTFRCTEQTLKEFLTSDDISTGEVCESYISQGNAEVVILYESPNDATTMTTDTTETYYLFGIDWSTIWMRTAITFLIFNLILCLILGTVVGSYYRKRFTYVILSNTCLIWKESFSENWESCGQYLRNFQSIF